MRRRLAIAVLFLSPFDPFGGHAKAAECLERVLSAVVLDYRDDLAKIQDTDGIRARLQDPTAQGAWPLDVRKQRKAGYNVGAGFRPDTQLTLFIPDPERPDFSQLRLFFRGDADTLIEFLQGVLPKQIERFKQTHGRSPRGMFFLARTEQWVPHFGGLHQHGGHTVSYAIEGDGTIIGIPDDPAQIVEGDNPKDKFKEIQEVPRGYAPFLEEGIFHGAPDSSYLPPEGRPKRLFIAISLD